MKHLSRVALLAGSLLGGAASFLSAQQADAVVTPRGMIGLHAGGTYTRFSSRFGGLDGGSAEEPLGARFDIPLTSQSFPLLPGLESSLNAFFAASDESGTAGFRASPSNLTLGTARFDYGVDRITAPLGLSVGVLPRISVEAMVPITSGSVSLRSIELTGGSLGLNPDATRNEALLRRAAAVAGDAALGALGGSAWLPLAGTPLGEELQRRVLALTDDTVRLVLPTAPLSGTALQGAAVTEALGAPGLNSSMDEWRLGDAEVGARVQLLGGPASGGPASLASGVALRVAAGAAARLPTGKRQELAALLAVPALTGHAGVSGNAAGDLFLSKWFWATVAGRFERIFPADVVERVSPSDQPFADETTVRTVRRSPGDVFQLQVVPRFRINEVLSIGGEYAYQSRGEETFEDVDSPLPNANLVGAAVLNTPSQSAQFLGGEARYSTLSTYFGGGGAVPVDVSLRYLTALSGSGGAPAAWGLELRGSVYIRAWGSR